MGCGRVGSELAARLEQGEHTVYHRLYDVANITVISNKNTVGVYDMESEVEAVLKPSTLQ